MDPHEQMTALLLEAYVFLQKYVEDNVRQRCCLICGTDHFQPHEEWCSAGQAQEWLNKAGDLIRASEGAL